MRTSDQIQAEIEEWFGFFPPFFEPAEHNPLVLENLWQQTVVGYIDNPLSLLFKEKLSAYLSRYCNVPYCLICHSCSLHSLGMKGPELLHLLESPPPLYSEIEFDLSALKAHSQELDVLSNLNSALEEKLLRCAIFIYTEQEQAEHCRNQLRHILKAENYQHLVTFISFIRTCHVWMEAYPEVSYKADKRSHDHLAALLEEEPVLAEFFQNYVEKVNQERRFREQVADSSDHQVNQTLSPSVAENLRLAQAVTSVAEGIIITDPNLPDNPILYSNPAFSRITGYQPDEIIGRNCRFLQGPNTDPQMVEQIRRGIIEKREVKTTLLNYRKDGQPFWNDLKISPVFSDAGELIYFVGIQADVTERKRSERKIREQAALLDITTDVMMVLDLNHKILLWNKAAERLYGWNAESILSKNAEEVLFKGTSPQLQENQEILGQTGSWQGELHQTTKDGREIIVDSRWVLVRDEYEQPKAILVVNTDITEKKQLETQFLRAQRMESIGTLASGIAHDLNNALAPVMMAVQLLEQKFKDEQSQRLLTTLEENTKRSADLVKQVLSFVRGLEGEHTLLQVEYLIQEMEEIAKHTFPKSIEIETYIPSQELWLILGDANQLHQVMLNLCINARDAMPEGGKLSITAKNSLIDQYHTRIHIDAKEGAYVLITISDTGMGMKPEILERIFEPFFTTKEFGKGTGLGLSTVQGIIKGHGGFVNVSSEVGKGSEFRIYLPAVETTKEIPLSEERHALFAGKGELILVVDDEDSICEITKTTLETYDYKVLTASDGIEGVAMYAQYHKEISVVVIDMMMPSMDGATAIRAMKKINPQVKVISVSGLISNQEIAEIDSNNIKAFLSKPYTADELLKSLNKIIREE